MRDEVIVVQQVAETDQKGCNIAAAVRNNAHDETVEMRDILRRKDFFDMRFLPFVDNA